MGWSGDPATKERGAEGEAKVRGWGVGWGEEGQSSPVLIIVVLKWGNGGREP